MNIQCFIMDVDGVLTDGTLIYGADGNEIKCFHAKDGMGLTAARKQGLKIGIITARVSPMVERRARELHFDFLQMGSHNKTEGLQMICGELGIKPAQVAYMGDDLNDLGPLSIVGLPMAPADACEEVKALATFVASHKGGHGAVRDGVEYILKKEQLWERVVESYASEIYDIGQ